MSVVIILLPLPGILATQVRKVQAAKMKKASGYRLSTIPRTNVWIQTDARVQTVTETMGVIRMIKLFGWELRILDQLNERRDEELQLDKKSKLLDLTNSAVKQVFARLIQNRSGSLMETQLCYTPVDDDRHIHELRMCWPSFYVGVVLRPTACTILDDGHEAGPNRYAHSASLRSTTAEMHALSSVSSVRLYDR